MRFSIIVPSCAATSGPKPPLRPKYEALCPVQVEDCRSVGCNTTELLTCALNGTNHTCCPHNVPYYQPPDTCRDACQYVKIKIGREPIGAYIPQCQSDGSYNPVQYWASTGLGWCVMTHGEPLSGFYSRGQVPNC